MATVERALLILRPPDEIWQVLSEFADISSWAPNVDHSCILSDQTAGVGAIRRIQSGRATLVETVVEWEERSRLSYSIGGLPPVIRRLADEPRGLVLVTGTAGSGKTTTLASMIDHVNSTREGRAATIFSNRPSAISPRIDSI